MSATGNAAASGGDAEAAAAAAAAAGSKRQAEARSTENGTEEPAAKRQYTGPTASGDTVLRVLVLPKQLDHLQAPVATGGSIIQTTEEGTGATIKLISVVPTCSERLLVIYSPHLTSEEQQGRGACAALKQLTAALTSQAGSGDGGASPGEAQLQQQQQQGRQHSLRLLISSSQASTLDQADSAVLHKIKNDTGARVKVLPLDQSPLCACANDRVVELSADSAEPLESAVGLLADHLKGHPAQERPGGISLALADAIKAAAARGGENGAQQGGGSGEDQQG